MKTHSTSSLGIGIAACSSAINAAGEIQLTPAGEFRGVDGRPADAPAWVMTAETAKLVVAWCAARTTPMVIDYEHQTLHKEKNGQPAPAAGWFVAADLVWREGEGFFVRADLTQRARDFIASGEYRYASPVMIYEKGTGRVVGLHSVALTNTPNIDGMDSLLSIAAASITSINLNTETPNMDIEELLEHVRWMLNLPTLAAKEEIAAELQKAIAVIKADGGEATAVAAASQGVVGLLRSRSLQIAALSAQAPDPAKYVPVATMQAVQAELNSLRSERVSELVTAALSSGAILPPQEKWARELGETNFAALSQYIETSKPLAALGGTQTAGREPQGLAVAALSQEEIKMCESLGVSHDDYLKTRAAGLVA